MPLDIPPSSVVAPGKQGLSGGLDNGPQSVVVPRVTPAQMAAMREWASDCEWIDVDSLDEYTDAQILRGVAKHFDGGVAGFLGGQS